MICSVAGAERYRHAGRLLVMAEDRASEGIQCVAIGDVHAQVPHLDLVRDLMRETQEQARAQPGCVSYSFAETLDEPGHFVTMQEWRDQASLEEHYRSEAYADFQNRLELVLVHSSELRIYLVGDTIRPIESVGDKPQFDE
jgi:quinol monooxygenase YgiN